MVDVVTQTKLSDLTVEDVQENDDSVMLYTGFPTFMSFMMIFQLLKPLAQSMSYWKGDRSNVKRNFKEMERRNLAQNENYDSWMNFY